MRERDRVYEREREYEREYERGSTRYIYIERVCMRE